MAEWWNVDQALIWMVTRNPDFVELATGDAKGAERRKSIYLDHAEISGSAGTTEANDGDGNSQGPIKTLMRLLRAGKIQARDVGQAPSVPVDTALFNEYACVVDDTRRGIMAVRTSAWPFVWLSFVIDADSVREHFPPEVPAPADMQDELSALFTSAPAKAPEPPSDPETERPADAQEKGQEAPRSAEVLRIGLTVKRWLDEHYPNGLPRADRERGTRTTVYREIAAYLTAEYGVANPSLDTIAKEARDWDKHR